MTEGTAITHSPGAGDISLTENGVYMISYSTTATNTSSTGEAGVQLEEDGTEIPGSKSSGKINNTSDNVPLSGTVLVNVTSSPVNITLNAVGSDLSFSDTSVAVTKLS